MQMLLLNIISAIIVELANLIAKDENEAKQRDKEVRIFFSVLTFAKLVSFASF